MAKYTLTLAQFKEFAEPYLKQIQDHFMENEHRQLEIEFNAPTSDAQSCFDLDFYVIGYHIHGRITISINNCFDLSLHSSKKDLIPDYLQEDMQKGLWKYCFDLYGDEYGYDLFYFILRESKQIINQLNYYIKDLKDTKGADAQVINKEIDAARDEIAYLKQYYGEALEFINELIVKLA